MKTKKILLSAYACGNMEALYDFYNRNLSYKYDKLINVNLVQHFTSYNNNKAIHYLTRALEFARKYDLVISDYPTRLFMRGRKRIFMSHGYGTKMTPGLNEIKDVKKIKYYSFLRGNVDYIITLSNWDSEYFLRSDQLEEIRLPEYLPLGLPRNDILFNKNFITSSRSELSRKYNIGHKKIMLYAPTWRGYKANTKFPFCRTDFEILDKCLYERDWIFFYRPHYIESILGEELISGLKNIIRIDFNEEPYTQKIIACADLLITDYSSIYVDFLLLNRPILFILFDAEEYTSHRGLVVDPDSNIDMPGPKIQSVKEFINYIEGLEDGKDVYANYREHAKKKFYKYPDGKSCQRVWTFIIKTLLGETTRRRK